MIYVTHDQVEAMTLADRIVVLSCRTLSRLARTLELYERHRKNLFVARFIGSPAMNVIPATVTENRAADADRPERRQVGSCTHCN